MKANELRIGNWLLTQNQRTLKKYVEVESITEHAINIDFREHNYSEVAPIPLTPEILVKCGFEWSIYHQAHHKQGFIFDLSARHSGGFVMHESRGKQQIICPEILWLHKLQNLYFALTGTELEVSL
jgi:hypothetical protein